MIDRRPLHEPYENRTAKQPNDFGEIIDNQTALRAVGPLIPPAPSPPAKALGAKGGQAVMTSSILANIGVYERLGCWEPWLLSKTTGGLITGTCGLGGPHYGEEQTAYQARWYVPRSMGCRGFEWIGSLGCSRGV